MHLSRLKAATVNAAPIESPHARLGTPVNSRTAWLRLLRRRERQSWRRPSIHRFAVRPLLADMKVPTFDGHLNESNTDFEEVFDGIHAAQEIDSGIQA